MTCPPSVTNLIGGTAMCSMEDTVFRICGQGQDGRNLGRWSYIQYEGKNQLITTIVTVYCPVKSKEPGSAYAQHLSFMSSKVII